MIQKKDLINELGNDKYYLEQELSRVVSNGEQSMTYKDKVLYVADILKQIASVDLGMQLANKYFVEKTNETPQGNGEQAQQSNAHPGQSHGE